jgi:inosine triphosphate pyrophosphatase
MAQRKVPITFITGNAKKLEEFKQIMTGDLASTYDISNMGLDLMEIQGSPEEIAKHKVKLAATKCNTPVLTEDVSLCFNAYNGLPGPYM